jgi:hypothetical protein
MSAAGSSGVKTRPAAVVNEDEMTVSHANIGCQWNKDAARVGLPASTPFAYPLRR